MQEVGEVLRHREVTETGHFFASVGNDRAVDASAAIFHVFFESPQSPYIFSPFEAGGLQTWILGHESNL